MSTQKSPTPVDRLFPADRAGCLAEREAIQLEIARIKVRLIDTLPRREFEALSAKMKTLGLRMQLLQARLTEFNRERREVVSEVFMQTVIQMFDAQDVADIWDRIYAEHPNLRP